METLSSIFQMSYWKRLIGGREQPLTSTSSATASSSGKLSSPQTLMKKIHELALENHRLKEEVRLLKLSRDCEHDI